jgi:hypothetical protein
MTQIPDAPTLHFFRATPPDMGASPPLASSFQSLETTLLLLSLERYPSALVSCVSAWESAIKAKFRIPPDDDRVPIAKLLGEIRDAYPGLMLFERALIDGVRHTRNRIVHYGFSPHDDLECGRLMVETGLPFLVALYRELFDFHLHWRDARPGVTDFMHLTADEAAKVGLVPTVSDQLYMVFKMYEMKKHQGNFDFLQCFTGFNHFIRLMLRNSYASSVDDQIADRAASIGIRYEAEHAEKKRIAKILGGDTSEFDCPMCNGTQSVIAGLNETALRDGDVSLSWAVCVSCQLLIPRTASNLADLILQRELEDQRTTILRDFG